MKLSLKFIATMMIFAFLSLTMIDCIKNNDKKRFLNNKKRVREDDNMHGRFYILLFYVFCDYNLIKFRKLHGKDSR